MTLPSELLDAVVARLDTLLAPEPGAQRVAVRAVDDTALADIVDYTTVVVPGVLVSTTSLALNGRDFDPPAVDATLVARCIARLPSRSAVSSPILSRGDVAMDLAATVEAIVAGELWGRAVSRASRVSARNVTSRELRDKGLSMWVVTWLQTIELTERDRGQLVHAFRRLQVELELEGGTSPDAVGMMTMEGREP